MSAGLSLSDAAIYAGHPPKLQRLQVTARSLNSADLLMLTAAGEGPKAVAEMLWKGKKIVTSVECGRSGWSTQLPQGS